MFAALLATALTAITDGSTRDRSTRIAQVSLPYAYFDTGTSTIETKFIHMARGSGDWLYFTSDDTDLDGLPLIVEGGA